MPWWKFWESTERAGPDYYEEGVELVRSEFYHDALTSFRIHLKQKPDDPATYEQIAVCQTHMGLPAEAIRAYRRALELRPGSPSAHYGLAFLYLKQGDSQAARRHLEEFLAHASPDRAEPQHLEHARRTLERLTASTRAT